MNNQNSLPKTDYEEPMCLLNMHPEITPIPVGRMIDKLDSLLNRNDYAAAERHLINWLHEAEAGHDQRGKLSVLNEQIGLYRKMNKEDQCLKAICSALPLAEETAADTPVSYGTTLVNAATGYKAFGKAKDALPLYRKAQEVYEAVLPPEDEKLGGLYNNMALTLTELGAYDEAKRLYFKAIDIMEKQPHGELEIAISYLNLADLAAQRDGLEAAEAKVEDLLGKAEILLNTETLPRDGYYAFVCEKCAPIYGYYGHFIFENELKNRARDIYERA